MHFPARCPKALTESRSPDLSQDPLSPETSAMSDEPESPKTVKAAATEEYNEEEDGDDGGFGDDFDDFEEGEEDAEFGDFDDGFQEPEAAPPPQQIPVPPSFPLLDLTNLETPEEIRTATEPFLESIFPTDTIDTSILPPLNAPNPIFLTPRSASLWSQLVAPPPLQPPNWIRSRIRRLFLVSLGIPVSLDEILPASSQKKLILPSLSPRSSLDSRRLKSTSSTSIDSQSQSHNSRSESRRRKGPPPAPQLDLVSARQLCEITDEALNGFTMPELKAHVAKLQEMEGVAKELLDYWTKRTDEKLGDREAFEGVIENLVQHARKVRK
ncbi:hypothetical protein CJF32_00005726 [Rutstroemia sp. NJR-2017a WRK4]|nr:hypothetical protein CJF32_00005726 [Rutstroemia sp. NJR-2017a WRK4]